jgi:hypothetical protein
LLGWVVSGERADEIGRAHAYAEGPSRRACIHRVRVTHCAQVYGERCMLYMRKPPSGQRHASPEYSGRNVRYILGLNT